MSAYRGKRCRALNAAGEPCRAPTVRNGFCHLHRTADRAKEVGRLGGLASVEARRRKRERVEARKVELAAARTLALAQLEREEERVARAFEAKRQALRAEAERLQELRDQVGRVDAETWVARRRELLEGREASAA